MFVFMAATLHSSFFKGFYYCTWYEGTVTGYRASDKAHCVEYDDEEEVYYFDLTIDFLNSDIVTV